MKKFILLIFLLFNLTASAQLLTTSWSSGCYYNYYQPVDSTGPCYKCFVSSTAVAMGQLMKYWQHPNKGYGSMSFTPYLYGTQSANFEHYYQWDSMPNSISSDNFHIARLLADCEVATTTNYSPYFYNYSCGLVNLDTVRIALNTHFGYKNGQVIAHNNNPNFETTIQNEIANNRPVIMEVYPYNNQCSKFCIVDGYNSNTQKFHINWGYSPYWNTWSRLDTIPFVYSNWGLMTYALIGIEPDSMNINITVKYDNSDDTLQSNININDFEYLTNGTLNTTLRKGWYRIEVTTDEEWGRVNSIDALLTMKHFVSMLQLSGLPLICADVNGNGTINSVDALMIAKRFSQLINSFPPGDWKFETFTVNQTTTLIIHGRCVGDTN